MATFELLSLEDVDDWPRACVVCQYEHSELIPAVNRVAAAAHRRIVHPWLEQHFQVEHSPASKDDRLAAAIHRLLVEMDVADAADPDTEWGPAISGAMAEVRAATGSWIAAPATESWIGPDQLPDAPREA
jgi:hypothetical protein